ncbi:MAG TPA: type I polyketide synthase, partial [Candidatus Angelobacter sp.]|nr:type I polyketide synthase [Candidatus Angelobacter sp.]
MPDPSNVYCHGYIVTPVIEACQQRGLFKLFDAGEFRERAWLINELKANEGYLTIALEALESLGWLEKNEADAYRLSSMASGYPELGLMSLYAVEPEQLMTQPHAGRFREKIEQAFFRVEAENSAPLDLARGAVLVPLVLCLQRVDADNFCDDLNRLFPLMSQTIIELFIRQQWLAADNRQLTASGKALLRQSRFNIAASYRLVLCGMSDLLFGDAVLDVGEAQPFMSNLLRLMDAGPAAIFDELKHAISEVAGGISELDKSCGHHLAVVDAEQPINTALNALTVDQPVHYLDRQGRLVDALTVLSSWQQHFRALAQQVHGSRLCILEAHAASSPLVDSQRLDFVFPQFDWIYRLAQGYLISAEAFITLAASVGLFDDDGVKRYPRTSDPCRVSMHNFIKRDYIVRHATESDLARLCELEELCWRHTQTPSEQIRSRLRQYPQGQFVLEKDGQVLGVIYSQRIASADALTTCNAADVHRLHQPSGPIVQLLAVNIDPQSQDAGYGDQLLEFMLQRCSLMTGVKRVVGVTLCKNYDSATGQSFERYIQQSGGSQDPVLAFHQAHGAQVVKAIPSYRPQDHANLGNGVLIAYDLLDRTPRGQRPMKERATAVDAPIDEQQVSQFVQEQAARLLNIATSNVDIDRPLMEMGLDSADLLKLQGLFEEKFVLEFQAGFFFEHNSLRKVIQYLTTRLVTIPNVDRSDSTVIPINQTPSPSNSVQPRVEKTEHGRFAATDIAIIGMSCKLPGGIETPGQLWKTLAEKKCVIGAFPSTRRSWPTDNDMPAIDQGGFVSDVDAFDASFFRISRAEAEITDPQQRILLQLAWACLEDAGILPEVLKGSNTGVFIGASNCDYSRLIQEAGLEVEAHHGTGSSLAVLANRLSYFFDFSGPSLLIDTACSSSLVALHTAIQSLRSGECATALVGGVNVICHPDLSIAYHKAGMLARDGRCKVFDAKADGYVRSEGAVMLLLKPLSAAVAGGDQIHAVIKGSAINHGGLAAGLTVPNPQKQSDLLMAAWQDASIGAHDLTCIEAHGTGTPLGDPIEIQGIQAAYTHLAKKGLAKPCAIGSVKSNLGHLEPAAGITGLLKAVLSIQHRKIPASINCDRLNPKIQLKDTPFFIPDQLHEWDAENLRLAAISSFGSGGANAHVVIQEYPRNARPRSEAPDHLFILSAASHERLRIHAMRVISWLEQESAGANFADGIYTWQVGRAAMKQRLAIKVKDHLELLSKLMQWLVGNSDVADLWSGEIAQKDPSISRVWQTKSGQQLIDQALVEGNLEQLGMLWASGVEIDWNRYYEGDRFKECIPRRISVPTYPFAKERYWIDGLASKQSVKGRSSTGPAELHPLLHSNTSNISELRFSSQFSGNEVFLADHLVKGAKVLPGVCHLEMARAAVMASATESGSKDRTTVSLKNVVWVSPIIVDKPQLVHIGLCADEQGAIEYEIYSNVPGEAADESSEVIHSRGTASLSAGEGNEGGWLDWLALKAGCNQTIDAAHCYAAFSAMGIEYGLGHRGIRSLGVGSDATGGRYVLAEIELPGCVSETHGRYVLHPSVLDSALQASMGFAITDRDSDPRSSSGGNTGKPSLPFELEEVEILDRSPAHGYVYIRESKDKHRSEQPGPVKPQKLDIDICDENGHVSVRLKGFTSRVLERELMATAQSSATTPHNESRIETTQLLPRWDAVMPERGSQWPSTGSRVLLVGGTFEQKQTIRARYPNVKAVNSGADDLIDSDVERVHTEGAIEHVMWLVPASEAVDVTDDRLIHEQSQGVLSGLRLIKTLLRLGYETKNLGWTIVTHQTQAIRRDELIQPSHASVHGLVGSLAKEYPHWKIRLVDVPSTREWPLDQVLDLPADGRGDALAYRSGEWYRQQLVPCRLPASPDMSCRRGGVYVVIGGAGGIGEVFSEHLIRNYQAQLEWIGRRELDAEIQAKLDRLSTLGPMPSYIRADATDRDALAQAHRNIKAQYGQIHGLVHAAIALADKSLAQMDEGRFKASLAAKVDVSVRMAQVFAQEPLDCVVFFSSLLSFSKPAGQSNYLAGCTFEDAFAHQLSQVWSCPVKIMNWGYWGSRGIVASEAYRARMAQNGVGSIEPEEGMAALEQLLAAPIPQLALSKARPGVLNASVSQDQITIAEKQLPHWGDLLSTSTNRVLAAPAAQDAGNAKDMQRLMGQLLFDQLRVLGLFNEGQGSLAAWKEQSKFLALYDRWLEESLRVLASEGFVTIANGRCSVGERSVPGGAALWSAWDTRKGEWLKDVNLNAQVRMVDATLRALPEILTGKRPATEILFPKSSMELVEGFYKGNPVADHFNAVLADSVVEFVELRRKHDPTARVRIIEVGAGTGGTSEGLFKRLKPYEACIAEYCYTDISKAFLMHAEQAYGPTTPYLAYRLLNIEQTLESQGMEPGAYDLAVATNVLHATKNIRKTLRNAKGLLKHNGVLLLNEILGHSLFTHLTFGLLEGWWLYGDSAVRIPGTPTLAPETWQRVLEGEGFHGVHFPAFALHAQGQQIIVAHSDGMIRQSRKEQPAVQANPRLLQRKEALTPHVVPQAARRQQTTRVPAEDIHVHWMKEKATAALKKIVGQTIKLPVNEIDSREEMEKYGIDSILIVSMVDALRSVFSNISSTVFFEYRTIDALVDHFIATEEDSVRRWVGAEDPVACEGPAPADQETNNLNSPSIVKASGRRRRNRSISIANSEFPGNGKGVAETHAEGIAIIGLSGRYPEAANIEAYWHNLRDGKDCIIEVPRERWDWRDYFSEDRSKGGRHYSKLGGFIAGVDEFDPRFFNIAPSEAKFIDPQERLFLQHAWLAIEDAGYTRASLQAAGERHLAGQVGVYAGVMYGEYQLFNTETDAQSMKMGFSGNLASIANRVSYVLNLHGPSMTLDTMCSSSLTAIHVACQDLRERRTSLAIAGGVNVSVHPNKYLMLSAGQFISGDGHCQSFGEGGDGFIPAEGVGIVVLKRLSEAEKDGDHIYGIIRGSAINHGGKTNGYTVPNPQAQTTAISRALAESHIDARHISYIEAHGTGTKLGDPIEIAALSKAFLQHTQDTGYCLIGSVKSNVGHCESAAGIAGLTKVLLQMQHQQIVPSLHSEQLNPHIDFDKSPFVVNQRLTGWQQAEIDGRKLPRIAGISSFGAGGSNAHMIVEEYPAAAPTQNASGNVIILLSARTAEQLKEKAHDLLDFIRAKQQTIDLVSMAYTLQVGREAMEERVGLVAGSGEQLIEKLEAYVAGKPEIDDVYRGQVKGNKELLSLFSSDADLQQAVEKWISGRKVTKLLELWVKGLEVEWSKLYGERRPRRMSLPGYPFARERYWIETGGAGRQAASHGTGANTATTAAAVLHPLVHSNTSDLKEQSYSATFSGEEFFVKDHQVEGH